MDHNHRHLSLLEKEEGQHPRSRWSVRPWLAGFFGFLISLVFLQGALVLPVEQRRDDMVEDTRLLLDVLAARAEERLSAYFGALRLLATELDSTDSTIELVESGVFRRRGTAALRQFDAFQAMTAMSPQGVILDIVPLEGNETALGLNVSSVPGAADALSLARKTGDLAMTPPIELAQGGRGFVGYLPRGNPAGSDGFFSAVFRVADFIEPLLAEQLIGAYSLRVRDRGELVFSHGTVSSTLPALRTSIHVGQRTWDLQLSPSPNRFGGIRGLSSLNAWLITVVVALLMGGVLYRLARGATAELESRAEAWRIAHLNVLTGLPNRYSLMRVLRTKSEAESASFTLLLIDLMQFRVINAIHGQQVADEVIRWVGERLVQAVPAHRVFHLGGAEYGVLAEGSSESAARQLAARLQSVVNQHVDIADVELDIDGEVGYVCVSRPLAAMEPLNRAGAALVRAKEQGGPQRYDETIREEAQARAFLESELRLALSREQLELHYQPICRFTGEDCETVGFEALLRWKHPELGNVRPDVFIPLAETSGLIDEIGRWVLFEACRQIATWQEQGHDYRVGINLSPRQMLDRGLRHDVEQALTDTGAPADSLVIEITESLAIRNLDSAVQLLSELRSVGVRIALDDFGTGYSSLSYLNLLPIDILKLDRVLISNIDREQQPLEIARGMIGLAHAIGLQVVAEGVETEQQALLLRSLRCDLAQGYLFDRPMPASEVLRRTGTS